MLLLWIILLFVSFLSLLCCLVWVFFSLVLTCLESGDPYSLLCVVFLCVFVTFPYCVSGHVPYLIVSILIFVQLLYKIYKSQFPTPHPLFLETMLTFLISYDICMLFKIFDRIYKDRPTASWTKNSHMKSLCPQPLLSIYERGGA